MTKAVLNIKIRHTLENFVKMLSKRRGRLHSEYKKAKPAPFKWEKVGLAKC
jgi:hypothetical protein